MAHIDALAYGGDGIARIEGKVCFVPFTIPGEDVEIEITEEKTKFSRGLPVKIVAPSKYRTSPFCDYFGTCGGCHFQHIAYKHQIELKEQILAETLKHTGGGEPQLRHMLPSPRDRGYRNSIGLHISPAGEPGYFKHASQEIVPITECPLAVPELNKRIGTLKTDIPLMDPKPDRVDLYFDEKEGLREKFHSSGEYHPPAFHQVNEDINTLLKRLITDAVKTSSDENQKVRILDLYCGNGNLSLQFTDDTSPVETELLAGIDANGKAIAEAAGYVKAAKKEYARFINGDAVKILKGKQIQNKFVKKAAEKGFSHIIADPPRAGLKNLVQPIARLGAEVILYISCSPPDLARDIRAFGKEGYFPESLTPLDMFPQTFHIEALAVFKKS